MRNYPRRSGTKVRNGKVSKKNRTELSNHYSQVRQAEVFFDRLRPGEGYKHFLTIADVKKFIKILPDWDELSVGLDAVILDQGDPRCMGWHWNGVVAVCAWERAFTLDFHVEFVEEHSHILDRLDVKRESMSGSSSDGIWCHFTDASIKGFQLMHILLHELGHHHDRMTTKRKASPSRGEGYAENYANKYSEQLWDVYFDEFGW